jgi:hypothetical protein
MKLSKVRMLQGLGIVKEGQILRFVAEERGVLWADGCE